AAAEHVADVPGLRPCVGGQPPGAGPVSVRRMRFRGKRRSGRRDQHSQGGTRPLGPCSERCSNAASSRNPPKRLIPARCRGGRSRNPPTLDGGGCQPAQSRKPSRASNMTSLAPLEPVTLTGKYVELQPLSRAHEEGLIAAVKDGELWNLWYTSIPRPEGMTAEIERRLGLQAAGSMLPFTVIDPASGRIVGMTTYMNIDLAGPRVEIGSTWYARSVQRSPLNT